MLHFERNSNGEVSITLGECEILQFSVFQYFSQAAPFYWSSLTWSLCFPVHFLPCERCFEEEKHSWVRSAKCYVYEELYNRIHLLLLNTLKGGELKALRDLVQCHPQIRHLSDSIFNSVYVDCFPNEMFPNEKCLKDRSYLRQQKRVYEGRKGNCHWMPRF